MTVLAFLGFECGANGPANNAFGTFSYQTSIVRKGTYAGRCNPVGAASGGWTIGTVDAAGAFTNPGFSSTTMYTSFYFYPAAWQASAEHMHTINTAAGIALSLRINSVGKLILHDSNGTQVATGTTVLTLNTWYKIEMKANVGSAKAYEVRINGVSEISGTCDQSTTAFTKIFLGKSANLGSSSVDWYYDDFIVDDAGYPADGEVKLLAPNANGSTQQWTSGTNASDYNEVKEVPADGGTTYVKCGTGGSQVALFKVATLGAGTINAVMTSILVREDTAVTSSNHHRVRSGGNNFDTSAVNQSTSYDSVGKFMVTDPNTSAAWTTAGVNAIEIGSIEDNAVAMRMDAARVEVHYAPSAAAGSSQTSIYRITETGVGTGIGIGSAGRFPS